MGNESNPGWGPDIVIEVFMVFLSITKARLCKYLIQAMIAFSLHTPETFTFIVQQVSL
jgi:hypothetical protein